MPRLIDADELINKIVHKYGLRYGDAILEIDNAPTVDAEPVRHGQWINISISVSGDESSAECDLCGAIVHSNFSSTINYCSFCGAKMDRVEENETD